MSQRRFERTKAALARRKAGGLPIGRQPEATDKKAGEAQRLPGRLGNG
jgi:hypothetical protein